MHKTTTHNPLERDHRAYAYMVKNMVKPMCTNFYWLLNSIYGEKLKSICRNQFSRIFSSELQPMSTIIDIHGDTLMLSDLHRYEYNKKYENRRTSLIPRNCQNLHLAIVQIFDLAIVCV